MTNQRQFCDADLNAWLDGELTEEARREIEAWLAGNPQEATRAAELRSQLSDLREHYRPVLSEPVPGNMQAILDSHFGNGLSNNWWRMAAAVLLFISGGVLGWFGHLNFAPPKDRGQTFIMSALQAHDMYANEKRHAVEVGADSQTHLVKWLSNRLGAEIQAPDLEKDQLKFIGGRLLPHDGVPAAQLMYEDAQGKRLTLYFLFRTEQIAKVSKLMRQGGHSVYYWSDGTFECVVTADMPESEMRPLAKRIYSQLIKKPTVKDGAGDDWG